MMIVLNVLYTVKSGRREQYYALLQQMGIPQASRDEAGNICYDYFFSPEQADQIFLREKWVDQAALQLHFQAPHFQQLQKLKEEWLLDTVIDKMEVE